SPSEVRWHSSRNCPRSISGMTDTEEPSKVCRSHFGYLGRWQVSHIPDGLRHFPDISRLVSPSPVRLRGQEGRIGFNEQLFRWNLSRDVPQILRLRIGHIARERNQEPHLHAAPSFLQRSRKAM